MCLKLCALTTMISIAKEAQRKQTFKEAIDMIMQWKRFLLLATVMCTTLVGGYSTFQVISLGGQQVKHETPEQVYARWLEREQRSRQPSDEEREVIRMCLWMSYIADKAVTSLLKTIDDAWEPSLAQHIPTWPRCGGDVLFFVDIEPSSRKEMERGLRRYVLVDGMKGELTTYPTPIPWLAGWGLNWIWKREKRVDLDVSLEWFRSVKALDEEWPDGNEALYRQVYGIEVAAVLSFAIKHGSFSGVVIGDDSFFPYGMWFGFERRYSEEGFPDILVFRKTNFRCRIRVMQPPVTEGEKWVMEQVARLIEAEIIAYSLFGLDEFTLLKVQLDGRDFYLPAGRISVGRYLMPVKYTVERVTGKRAIYDLRGKQMGIEVEGRREVVKGELMEAANKYFPLPEEERFIADWEAIRTLLGLRKVQDIRFE